MILTTFKRGLQTNMRKKGKVMLLPDLPREGSWASLISLGCPCAGSRSGMGFVLVESCVA